MTAESPAIRTTGLVKRFDDVVAVRGVDLAIARGECFGLLGPNGAGKTTTIEILEGLQAPSEGTVELLGLSWRAHESQLRGRVGVALQETRLPDKLTVRETLALFRSFYRDGRDPDALLTQLQLSEKRDAWVVKLSGGQRQRLALACALVSNPDVLFLDEPTTGLDPQSRRAIWDLVLALRAQGKTIMLTTHYMEEAERLCDRVAVVDQGKIIALGTPRELISRLGAANIIEIETAPALPPSAFEGLPGVRAARIEAKGVALSADELHVAVPALLARVSEAGVKLTELRTHHATLEDVFVSLTGRRLREE